MSPKSRKTQSGNSENGETLSKPLGRKVASRKTKEKKDEIGNAIKTSQRKRQTVMKQGKDELIQTDPKLQKFEDLGARIAQRAYELYESRGSGHGHDLDDWIEAERQILTEQESRDL